MAHTLKHEVVAEAVENAEQLALLRSQGCDQIQGFFYSRPLQAAALVDFLRESKHPSSFAEQY